MSNQTKTVAAWEPSDNVRIAAMRKYNAANPFLVRADHADALEASLVAAVAADPLLSAAAEMREALASLVYLVETTGDSRKDAIYIEAGRTALRHSRGEN